MGMLFLLGFVLALCGHVQGQVAPPTFTEQPLSDVGVEAVIAKPRSIRLDAVFNGGATCRDFWQAPGLEQFQPPTSAYRQAFTQTLEAGIQLSGVSVNVASISVVCNDPAPKFQSDLRRVSMTAQLTPDLTFADLNTVFQDIHPSDVGPSDFFAAFVSFAGPNSPFQPQEFAYLTDKYNRLCIVGSGHCAPYSWDPTTAHIITMG